MRFRTKTFLSAFAVAAGSLVVASLFASPAIERGLLEEIEQNLVIQTRLTAELLDANPQPRDMDVLDAEADAIGAVVSARVTLIARDGTVVGDSGVSGPALRQLENHRGRPEVAEALAGRLTTSRRYSTTVGDDLLYVAVPVASGPVAVVRLAMPLTRLSDVKRTTRHTVTAALLVALVGAVGLAWISSRVLSRRLDELAGTAARYATGDFTPRMRDSRNDELGSVARVLDDAVQTLGRRVTELGRDRARMEAILSGMVEGVIVVNEAGQVQLVNDAARRMLRLAPSALGQRYLDLIRHPDIASQIGRALHGDIPDGLELSITGEGHQTLIARAAPVSSEGGGGAVVVLHDITDLRRTDRIRRDFVANVSHELRTPLTAIRGYVEALLDAPVGPDDTQRFLEIVARHTSRMERLVKDLLRLARLDAGQEPLDLVECSVDALFASVVSDLAPTLDTRRQTVAFDVAPGAAMVLGDPAKLHDLLRNLVENAAAYSPERSEIRLAAADEGTHFALRVVDQGPGIPEADRSRIFERFYRVDKARSRESGGTGLGLSIVRHLVELHQGEVSAANRPGGGAMFTVRLPKRRNGTRPGGVDRYRS